MHKSVEVGVHPGLHVGDARNTADFGLLCTKRLAHGDRRESLISMRIRPPVVPVSIRIRPDPPGVKPSLAWTDTSGVDDMASAARHTAWRALLETSGQDGGRALGRTRSGSVEEQPPRGMQGAVTQRELVAKLAAAHVAGTDRYRRLLDRSRVNDHRYR